jgi:RNA polymerase sigma factor (TIGR02999 family)
MSQSGPDVTRLLRQWAGGDVAARDDALSALYQELKRVAAIQLRRERPGQTLQPTALVHEVYLRLANQDRAVWQNRAHFLAVAAQIMRRILVDRARARLAAKRSGKFAHIEVSEAREIPLLPPDVGVIDLNNALDELAALDPRKSRIAEMKFFGGLSLEEMGEVLDLSPRTVDRDWQAARALLYRMLSGRRDV